ncbi:MAG: GNAT family N-acetyltransferase [Bacteroidales bacterium]
MQGFRIRDYKDDDYKAVTRLWEATGMGNAERGDDKETIERCMKTGGRLLILEEEKSNTVAGSSWMTFDGRRIYLHHFGILPEYQGRGLSKHLLEESMKHVKETGYQVKLEVHRSNRVAINLYKNSGFKYLGDYQVFIIRDIDNASK